MDQQLPLETPGWIVLDFSGNPLPDEEVARQRVRIIRTPLVRLDLEYRFCEDFITDDAGVVDTQLPILAKDSSLLELPRPGGSNELMEQLWAQFSLTTSCVNNEGYWLRKEVLVSNRLFFVSDMYLVPENYVTVPENYVFGLHFHG